MASFTITDTSATLEVLTTGETGFIGVNGALTTAGTAIDGDGSIRITILGAVQAFGGIAIDHDGTDMVLDVGAQGYLGSSTSDTVNALVTSSALVSNFGVIQSDSDALDLRDSDGSALIRVVNHGDISGRSDGVVLQSGTGTTTVINTGTITALSYGIFNAFSGQAGTTFVDNSGTITGLTLSYGGDDSTEIIHNSGTMIGGIDLDDGNDIYVGLGGTVIGNITGELGNDTFDLIGANISGSVAGGADDDTYIVDDTTIDLVELADEGIDLVEAAVSYTLADNFENLTLIGSDDISGVGNGQNNKVTGNAGNNTLRGGGGRDLVSGGDGDDFLTGNTGNDRLRGGADDDVLRGGAGDDDLRGGDGDDVLYGGAGVDALSGDDGFDTFAFDAVNASPIGSNSDRILDFEIGSDAIDLSGLASGQLEMSILGAFTGTGPSARTAETGGDTRVFVDADGNGTADMRIIVVGVVGLTAADFVL